MAILEMRELLDNGFDEMINREVDELDRETKRAKGGKILDAIPVLEQQLSVLNEIIDGLKDKDTELMTITDELELVINGLNRYIKYKSF